MKFLSIVFVFLSFYFSGVGQASEYQTDFDKQFCAGRDKDKMCFVSIINLIATPERLHGIRVRLTAYLYADGKQTYLNLLPGT